MGTPREVPSGRRTSVSPGRVLAEAPSACTRLLYRAKVSFQKSPSPPLPTVTSLLNSRTPVTTPYTKMGSTAPNTPERVSEYMPESRPVPIATLLLPDGVVGQLFMNKDELATLAALT